MKNGTNIIIENLDNGISRIKLNEPDTYNALSSNNLKLLIEAFKKLNNAKKTKVIIIEGSGKGFSAGHNLKEVSLLKKKKKILKII